MLGFFQGIETWKLLFGAVAAIAFLWPRREAILAKLGGVFKLGGSATTTPDANAIAAAYKLLEPYLDDETADLVKSDVSFSFLSGVMPNETKVKPVAVEATKASKTALETFLEALQNLADEKISDVKPEEVKP